MIKISVAIGTWNRVDMVRQGIQAALNQTLLPYEIIVFDDASPDNTFEILSKEFKDHPIVKLYKQEVNTGGVPNWNAAINACSGVLSEMYCHISSVKNGIKGCNIFKLFSKIAIMLCFVFASIGC